MAVRLSHRRMVQSQGMLPATHRSLTTPPCPDLEGSRLNPAHTTPLHLVTIPCQPYQDHRIHQCIQVVHNTDSLSSPADRIRTVTREMFVAMLVSQDTLAGTTETPVMHTLVRLPL